MEYTFKFLKVLTVIVYNFMLIDHHYIYCLSTNCLRFVSLQLSTYLTRSLVRYFRYLHFICFNIIADNFNARKQKPIFLHTRAHTHTHCDM